MRLTLQAVSGVMLSMVTSSLAFAQVRGDFINFEHMYDLASGPDWRDVAVGRRKLSFLNLQLDRYVYAITAQDLCWYEAGSGAYISHVDDAGGTEFTDLRGVTAVNFAPNSNHYVYVADYGNMQVHRFHPRRTVDGFRYLEWLNSQTTTGRPVGIDTDGDAVYVVTESKVIESFYLNLTPYGDEYLVDTLFEPLAISVAPNGEIAAVVERRLDGPVATVREYCVNVVDGQPDCVSVPGESTLRAFPDFDSGCGMAVGGVSIDHDPSGRVWVGYEGCDDDETMMIRLKEDLSTPDPMVVIDDGEADFNGSIPSGLELGTTHRLFQQRVYATIDHRIKVFRARRVAPEPFPWDRSNDDVGGFLP